MDNEKIFTIVDTETQRTAEIRSTATNVAELKRDLRQNGFNVDGKTIQEALTRIEFKDDNSTLPHDVPYQNGTTNNLVFRLTKTNKQVKSGMDRQEAYAKIKEMNLAEAVKNRFGKNFTQCSTSDLIIFIEANSKKGTPKKSTPKKENKSCKKETPVENKCNCKKYIENLVSLLIDNGTLDESDYESIFGSEVEAATPVVGKSIYSKDELNNILSGL